MQSEGEMEGEVEFEVLWGCREGMTRTKCKRLSWNAMEYSTYCALLLHVCCEVLCS